MHNFRTNTGIRANSDTRVAQGDFPVKVQSIKTRPPYLEPELNREGSIEAGTSMEQSLYEVDNVNDDMMGDYDYGI